MILNEGNKVILTSHDDFLRDERGEILTGVVISANRNVARVSLNNGDKISFVNSTLRHHSGVIERGGKSEKRYAYLFSDGKIETLKKLFDKERQSMISRLTSKSYYSKFDNEEIKKILYFIDDLRIGL